MRFQRISNFSQQYRTDATWMNLSSSVSVSNMNAVKLQTSNQPFYFNYRTRNRGKGWLGYILSKSTAEFAGWKGYPVTGLEIQMYNSGGKRIFDDYIVMFRSKVAGEWLSWISNASLDIMEEIQNEQGLGGTLDGDSTFSGWESKGDIQAIDIRVYKDNGTNTGEILPPNVDFSQQYRTNTAWMNLNSAVNVTSMNAIRLLTRNKPYFLKYRTRNRGKGWLGYILSTNNTDFAGWKGYPVTGFEIQLFANNGTRLFDTHAVMYRSKVAGEWLSWISNVSLDIMERLQTKHNLGGTLDASSTFSGWESRGDVQAIDIRVYENVGTSSPGGETPPPVTADFAQQYRTDSTWLNLTPSVTVTSMNAIRLQTKNKPFYLNYRTRNRGKGWLGYILSTNSVDFAGWKGFPVSGLEIQLFANNGIRLFDTHAVMYRSKVAGEWLSWISNVDEEIMTRLQLENNLGGTLDPSSDFSGWESRGDIQAIEIRLFENVGASTGELPPAPPDSDFDIPNAPNNPNGYRIYIDAGHGGSDPGACNGSCYEKNYTLELSLLQKQYFEQAGYKVTLSREDDRFVDNAFKANQANQLNADLYIANHINSFGTISPNGVEVYNQVNPSFMATGKAVAQKIVANLSTMFNSRGVKTRTQDDGRDWYCVLRETNMPAVLVEHCFISNSADLAKLNDPSHIDTMAKAVVKAVCDTLPNPEVDYEKAKLAAGIKILKSMEVIPFLQNVDLVLNEGYEVQVTPNLLVKYEISATGSFVTNNQAQIFTVTNGKFSLDVANEIELYCKKIEEDANPIFSSPFPPLLPEFPSIYNLYTIGTDISIGLNNKLDTAAIVIGNGNFSFSVNTISLLMNTLEISTAFNSKLNDDPFDFESHYGVKITYILNDFHDPFKDLGIAIPQEAINAIALGGLAVIAIAAVVTAASGIAASGAAAAVGTFLGYIATFLQRLFNMIPARTLQMEPTVLKSLTHSIKLYL